MRWPTTALPRKILQDLRKSYWFLPLTMTCLALLGAAATEAMDRRGWVGGLSALLYAANVDAARSVLSVIASAAIGAAGVMFSMTVVAVSFASTNFGPRLIGNFMQDRGVQLSLGTLVATFVYALMILRGIHEGEDGSAAHVPELSMTIALMLAILSVVVLIYFVHHIPEMISLENVTARLGRNLLRTIADHPPAYDAPATPLSDRTSPADTDAVPIYPKATGYLQAVNTKALGRLDAALADRLEVLIWPGSFVAAHIPVARITGSGDVPEADKTAIAEAFAVGDGRTEAQNPLFVARQLTEIIARALSPGINDPYTAITCLDWLHAALHAIARQGAVDIVPSFERPPMGFLAVLDAAHAAPRAYIAGDVLVTEHAFALLGRLEQALPQGPRKSAVAEEQALLRKAHDRALS